MTPSSEATPAAREIAAAIDEAGGAISFERFVELALYGRHGFYATGGRAGRRGDFITSPEVGPLFGTVLGRFLDAEWRRLGHPARFTVIDAGAGPGTLARSILAAPRACRDALDYVAVEVSPTQRAAHPDGIRSVAELPAGPIDGVIVANELLDNLPFELVVFDGAWRPAFVRHDAGRFVELLGAPLDPVPSCLPVRPRHGTRAPLLRRAAAWIDDARARLRAGSLVIIDYASPLTAAMVGGGQWRRWLRTYRGHERGSHYLSDPGEQDVTVELALDQLPEPDAVRTQAQFLQLHGIDELVDEGRAAWSQAAASPDLAAMRMRSRVREAEALLDPSGLGAFSVLTYRAG